MPNYTYLIVGGGMTAAAAIGGIREVDPNSSIGLIGAESHPPYVPAFQEALERPVAMATQKPTAISCAETVP